MYLRNVAKTGKGKCSCFSTRQVLLNDHNVVQIPDNVLLKQAI